MDSQTQKIVCIVAAQRAGTTALQAAIAGDATVRNFGEIFQDTPPDETAPQRPARSFQDFARMHDVRLADAMRKKYADDLAERYIAFLGEAAAGRHVLLDVKLNAWLALSPAWGYPNDEPLFLRHLKRHGAIFVFVWRENLAEQVLSVFISRKLGVWHNIDADKVGGRQFKAPLKWLKKEALLICQSEAAMLGHLSDYGDKIVIAYEDLFRDGRLGDGFRASFRDLSGIELRPAPPGIRRNSVAKSEIVPNYEGAIMAIRKVAAAHRDRRFARAAQDGG
jgi:LPS sulfotransferase NodH